MHHFNHPPSRHGPFTYERNNSNSSVIEQQDRYRESLPNGMQVKLPSGTNNQGLYMHQAVVRNGTNGESYNHPPTTFLSQSQRNNSQSANPPSHATYMQPKVSWPPWSSGNSINGNASTVVANALPNSMSNPSLTSENAAFPDQRNSHPPGPPRLPTSNSSQAFLSTAPPAIHATTPSLNGTSHGDPSVSQLVQDVTHKMSFHKSAPEQSSRHQNSHLPYHLPPFPAAQNSKPVQLHIPEHTRVVNLMRVSDPMGEENTMCGGKNGPLDVNYPMPMLPQIIEEKPNCSPTVLSSTLNAIPATSELLQESRLPLGLILQPFRDLSNLSVIQTRTIVRCKQCRSYIHPFVSLLERGSRRWRCSMCFRSNELPDEFHFDPVTKRYTDPQRRLELRSSTVEYIAPGEYALRKPQAPLYFFLFEVTRAAVQSGYLHLVCRVISQQLNSLPGDDRTLVGFLAYGDGVDFFQLNGASPCHYSCIDVDEIYFPVPPSNLLVKRANYFTNIVDLLDALPNMYYDSRQTGNCLGFALKAALQIIGRVGGRITVFNYSLPTKGFGLLKERHTLSQQTESLLQPANDFYKNMALECAGLQVCIDIFSLGKEYQDLATISDMCRYTGGTLYRYANITHPGAKTIMQHADSLGELDRARLRHDLTRYLTRKIGFEAVLRLRCTKGISITAFHGNGFVRSTDLMSLTNVNPDSGFAIQLDVTESLSDLVYTTLQAALLYTSCQGDRRIRVHTLCIPVAHNHSVIYQHANHYAITTLLSKMAVERVLSSASTGSNSAYADTREALLHALLDPLRFFSKQQHRSASMDQLSAPYHLRHLARFVLALLKYPALLPMDQNGTVVTIDDRVAGLESLRNYPMNRVLPLIYPLLWDAHRLPSDLPPHPHEMSQQAPPVCDQNNIPTEHKLPNPPSSNEDDDSDEEGIEGDYGDDSSQESASSYSQEHNSEKGSLGTNGNNHVSTLSHSQESAPNYSAPTLNSQTRLDTEVDKWLAKGTHSNVVGPNNCIRQLPASTAFLSRDGAYVLDQGEYLMLLICRDLSAQYLHQLFAHSSGGMEVSGLPVRWNTSPLVTQMDDHLIPRTSEAVNCYLRSILRHLHTNRRMGTVLCIMRDISPLRSLLVMQRLPEDRWSASNSTKSNNPIRALSPSNIQVEAATCSYVEFLQMIAQAVQNMR